MPEKKTIDMFEWKKQQELEEELRAAAMAEAEYREFVKLLRHLVNIQRPKEDYVKVEMRCTDKKFYGIFDREGTRIGFNEFIEQLKEIDEDIEIDFDDLVLSSLVTISPAKIEVFAYEEIPLFDTLREVFGDRITINICPK